MQVKESSFRKEIEGLRAFSVIAVIIYHFNKNILPGGYLGVDIFFVISGFLITASLLKKGERNFKKFLINFYARRIKRLFPTLAVFVAISSLTICYFDPKPSNSLFTGISSLLGLSNIYLFQESTNYFAPTTTLNPFTHTWSLGVEWQFYLIFPFFVWFSKSINSKNTKDNLLITVISLSFGSLLLFLNFYYRNQSMTYFLMPFRFWEIGIGSISYILQSERFFEFEKIQRLFPASLLFISIIIIMLFPIFYAPLSNILIAGIASLLISYVKIKGSLHKLLTNKIAVQIGLISYPLYIWHWYVISLSEWTIGINFWTIPFQIFLIFTISFLSYQSIEIPFKNLKLFSNNLILFSSSFFIFLISLLNMFVLIAYQTKIYSGKQVTMLQKGSRSLQNSLSNSLTKSKWNGADCWFKSNELGTSKDIIKFCSFGDFKHSKRRIIVIGNSFAPSFAAMFDKVASETKYSFLLSLNAPKNNKNYVPTGLHRNGKRTDKFVASKNFNQLISMLRKGDALLWAGDLHKFLDISSGYKNKKISREFNQGLQFLNKKLIQKNIKFLILDALPLAREAKCDPNSAIDQWYNYLNSERCVFPSRKITLSSRKRMHKEVFKNLDNLYKIDLFNDFCPDEECSYFDKETKNIIYRDAASHVSVEKAIQTSESFKKKLQRILN